MEISGLGSTFPFIYGNNDKEAADTVQQGRDIVDIHAPELLADEDVEGVLNETIGMIGADSAAALSVHSGLSRNRAFALLGL